MARIFQFPLQNVRLYNIYIYFLSTFASRFNFFLNNIIVKTKQGCYKYQGNVLKVSYRSLCLSKWKDQDLMINTQLQVANYQFLP